jgi:hypothetical protein
MGHRVEEAGRVRGTAVTIIFPDRADRKAAEKLVLAVAQGKVTKEAVIQFFSDHVRGKSPA